MYRILLLLTLACTFVFPTRAQYVRVNYDKKTVAAMVAAYGTETVAEAYYNEQVKAILERYNAAEIAAAGIFTSKFLDRKGLTELGIWSNQTENQYYRRIYHLVSAKITAQRSGSDTSQCILLADILKLYRYFSHSVPSFKSHP